MQSGEIQKFVKYYKMNVERCLKTMAMDPKCVKPCSEKPIFEFGKGCTANCSLNAEKVLTQSERHVILYSFIYLDQGGERQDNNLHPDVRE